MAFQLGDKTKTALLIMDMQNDIVHEKSAMAQHMGFAQTVRDSGVVKNIRRLLDASRAANISVVHIVVDFSVGKQFQMPDRGQFFKAITGGAPMLQKGTWGAQIHDDLAPAAGEQVIGKSMFSAFASSNLHEVLRARNVTQLILTGVATEFVVDSTSWNASDLGYNVIIPRDGCCGQTLKEHEDAIRRMAARADISSTDELIAALR
ncbi:MAG: cysteine hydrolase [Candidatus Binataceae bacterium]|nr:cysteine hydrolase [Candidatus Binataceae bacterium]